MLRKLLKLSCFALFSSLLAANIYANDQKSNKNTFIQQNEQVMGKMHSDMMSIKYTGNNDIDFMRMMIPHHQAAIDMAQLILKTTKDKSLEKLAKAIIVEQKKEIALMQKMIKEKIK